MKLIQWTIAFAIIAAVATTAKAQNQPANNQSPAAVSPAQAVIDKAAKANKYVFIFCWKTQDQKTSAAKAEFDQAAAKLAELADVVSIQINDDAEKKIVQKHGLIRAPMPLVLAIAPCGAVTKGFTKKFDEQEIRTAFVSPCTQLCMKALQDRKLLLVCVVEQANPQDPVKTPKCAEDFKADAKYGQATEIVFVNAKDQAEAGLLKDFKVDQAKKPTVVFLAPPGVLIGNFDAATATKDQLVAKLAAAQSNPCGGGRCGPGGCK
jgi:hypothetical protein